jgi:hypothetical protein
MGPAVGALRHIEEAERLLVEGVERRPDRS